MTLLLRCFVFFPSRSVIRLVHFLRPERIREHRGMELLERGGELGNACRLAGETVVQLERIAGEIVELNRLELGVYHQLLVVLAVSELLAVGTGQRPVEAAVVRRRAAAEQP